MIRLLTDPDHKTHAGKLRDHTMTRRDESISHSERWKRNHENALKSAPMRCTLLQVPTP